MYLLVAVGDSIVRVIVLGVFHLLERHFALQDLLRDAL